MKEFFKTIQVWFMCWAYPKNLLLKRTNHTDFSLRQQGFIGSAMLRRFDTQEELEQRCEELFNGTEPTMNLENK